METIEVKKRLLDHPFYQAWEKGEVTEEQLADYGEAYQEFMEAVPGLWQKVLDGLDVDDPTGDEVVADEKEHAELWEEWRAELPEADEAPRLADLLDGLVEMGPAELAGALHAYELQQPEVAETKKQGLIEHYGFDVDNLEFFDEHAEGEEEHLAFGRKIRDEYADAEAFTEGFNRGAELVFHSLDAFVA